MAFDIQRKAELCLVGLLGEILPDFTFYPSKGGDDEGGTTLPRPPFGAIWIDNAEKMVSYNKTYMLTGTVVWVTRATTDDVAEHSDAVEQIYNALSTIAMTQCPGADPVHSIIVHGLDVGLVNEFSDTDRKAHGDTVSFTMGASEFD